MIDPMSDESLHPGRELALGFGLLLAANTVLAGVVFAIATWGLGNVLVTAFVLLFMFGWLFDV